MREGEHILGRESAVLCPAAITLDSCCCLEAFKFAETWLSFETEVTQAAVRVGVDDNTDGINTQCEKVSKYKPLVSV